jgi:predicted DNA-binding transcriptional regulator YafY
MEQELREYLFLTNKAIEDSRILEFEYINRKMEYLMRIVEPIKIEFTSGQWYIIGFCKIRKDFRKFKLVRIRNMKLGGSFIKKSISKEAIEKIFSESYEKNSILVTLKFSRDIGEQLSEYFSKDKIRTLDNGTYVVEDFFPEDEGLKKFILGFGKDCEVISPSRLRKEMMEYIKNIYSKYNDSHIDVSHYIL